MTTPVEVRPDDKRFASVITLADRHRGILGFFPQGAFKELAAKGHLLAVFEDDELAGYALYDIARSRVRLIHLCVDHRYRGRKIAQTLVRHISAKHPNLAGIAVKCRQDFDANDAWPKLGFRRRGESLGRGKDRAVLVSWWRSHGQPDLFSALVDPEATTVAIDHNVFLDLVDPRRDGAEESRALTADWLDDEITLTVTSESWNETGKLPDLSERRKQEAALLSFVSLERTEEWDRLRDAYFGAIGDVPADDEADCRHLVDAAAGGARIFVTRDDALIARYGAQAADILGVRLIRPSDLITHLDEVANAAKYRPADLQGTELRRGRYGAAAEPRLAHLLNNAGGERKTAFRQLLRDLAADPRAVREWILDDKDEVLAAWATRTSDNGQQIQVPLFRFDAMSSLGATLGRLIILEVKRKAVDEGSTGVVITDPQLPRAALSSLAADGFTGDPGEMACAVVNAQSSTQALDLLRGEHPYLRHARDLVVKARTPSQVADAERVLWPLKLIESEMPSYLVPITPVMADRLLGLRPTLLERPPILGLSRELVYYRATNNAPSAPARIAWYVSDTTKKGVGAVAAVSRLTEVHDDAPSVLHRRYQHLGVYRLEDIKTTASRGSAQALKFADTEILDNPVPYERLRMLNGGVRVGTIQSPTVIPPSLFAALYRQGRGRDV